MEVNGRFETHRCQSNQTLRDFVNTIKTMKTEDSDIQRVWLCDACGEMCTGDMCRKCGRDRPPSTPYAPDPSSYLGIIGAPRTIMAGKFLLVILIIIYAAILVVGRVASVSNGPVISSPDKPAPNDRLR